MKKLLLGHCVATPRFAPLAAVFLLPSAVVFLLAGCAADDSGSPDGASAGQAASGSGSPVGSSGSASTGAVASVGGSGPAAGGGANLGTGGGSGATAAAAGGTEGINVAAGGSLPISPSAGGSGQASAGIDGSAGVPGAGGSATVAVTRTVDLIGPGAATCGATNATHGDGFVCVLNYPSEGPNVVGYWFDYAFTAGTCNLGFTKPPGNAAANPQVCFSGSACPATSGGGLGVALCDVHGIDVSTWPQLEMLETTSSLSSTVKSPISGCNPGATIPSISWTLGSGSIPAGTSVLFDDAADVSVARVDLAAGATSVDVPAGIDASKVATIKFSVSGASSTSWDFCLTSLTVSLR